MRVLVLKITLIDLVEPDFVDITKAPNILMKSGGEYKLLPIYKDFPPSY